MDILIKAIYLFSDFLTTLLIVRAILSWFPISTDNFIISSVHALTEPILVPIRSAFNRSPIGGGMLDFSVLFAYFLIQVVRDLLVTLISAM